ncbi:MAG: dockerin type I domain-containing protein [Planctomycetota bacterium]
MNRILALIVILLFQLPASSYGQYGPDGQVPPGGRYHLCFATSFQTLLSSNTTVPPVPFDFGGIEAASWLTNFAAAQSGLLPDWDGATISWRAVLSDSTANAIDHTNIVGPVYNVVGQRLANDAVDFFDGELFHPIGFDEFGNPIDPEQDDFWSGTAVGGVANLNTCGNWDLQSTILNTLSGSATSLDWVFGGQTFQCDNQSARLLAMGPAIAVPGPGDVNCDGLINLLDIGPFVQLLSDGSYDIKADMNFDGFVNLLDIGPFVEALSAN